MKREIIKKKLVTLLEESDLTTAEVLFAAIRFAKTREDILKLSDSEILHTLEKENVRDTPMTTEEFNEYIKSK